MRRCLELALLGSGYVAPNPMVGSLLVYPDPDTGEERIIGEGYHERYGERHAEANCIASVKEEDRPLIARSTIYVSLEPCAHYGKQPPCADLIIRERIPRVVAGCRDPFPQVNGKGIERLRAAGVEVVVGVLEAECVELNRRFFTFNTKHRPYVVLKWAQSADGKIGSGGRVFISNEYSNRLVHKWRAEESAILVGTRTALMDDPALTVRLWNGPDPIRMVIDKELRLPSSLRLFDGKARTLVFNLLRHEEGGPVEYYQLSPDSSLVHQLGVALTRLKITSVLVEGGARLLQSFIEEGYWDEARVITSNELMIPGGLPAPELRDARLERVETLAGDMVRYYRHEQ
jgi:diaminohydroxyphosphoribosylaminopyrimidine deaminase/5-amino-6-(5-phosphoribosylamino)uracil reductase